jgi:hypothetical protein
MAILLLKRYRWESAAQRGFPPYWLTRYFYDVIFDPGSVIIEETASRGKVIPLIEETPNRRSTKSLDLPSTDGISVIEAFCAVSAFGAGP